MFIKKVHPRYATVPASLTIPDEIRRRWTRFSWIKISFPWARIFKINAELVWLTTIQSLWYIVLVG